jgi:hypothetical protein
MKTTHLERIGVGGLLADVTVIGASNVLAAECADSWTLDGRTGGLG